jgi:hypothetical protein
MLQGFDRTGNLSLTTWMTADYPSASSSSPNYYTYPLVNLTNPICYPMDRNHVYETFFNFGRLNRLMAPRSVSTIAGEYSIQEYMNGTAFPNPSSFPFYPNSSRTNDEEVDNVVVQIMMETTGDRYLMMLFDAPLTSGLQFCKSGVSCIAAENDGLFTFFEMGFFESCDANGNCTKPLVKPGIKVSFL